MTHKYRHKQLQRIKQKYKNLAAIVAAATILSTTALLPGIPIGTAHASASQATDNMSATTSQGIGKTNQSATQINANSSIAPVQETQQDSKAQQANSKIDQKSQSTPKTTKKIQSESKTSEPSPTVDKKTETTPEPSPTVDKKTETTPEPSPTVDKKTETTPEPSPTVDKKTETTPEPSPTIDKKAETTPEPSPTVDKKAETTPPTDYTKVLDIAATAYAPGPHDNDQWGNKTYIGSQVRPGIIAVDPNVIPLGSRVYIEYPDGHGEYAIAEDTGGAIKGNRVDIAKWTVGEAEKFGIQNVKVYIVSTPEKI